MNQQLYTHSGVNNRQSQNGLGRDQDNGKRSRKGLWVSIVVLLILILLLGFWQLGNSNRGKAGVSSISPTISEDGFLSYVDADGQTRKVRLTPIIDMVRKQQNVSPSNITYVLQGTNLVVTSTAFDQSGNGQPVTSTVDLAGLIPKAAPQQISLSGSRLTLSDGNSVNLSSLLFPVTIGELTGQNGVSVSGSLDSGDAQISIATAAGNQTGLLSAVDWVTFNNKENALLFNGNGMFSRTGNMVNGAACAAMEVLMYDGSSWVCSAAAAGSVISVSGSGAVTSSGGAAPTVGITTSGALSQVGNVLDLTASGALAGTYGASTGSASAIPIVTVDSKGRVTGISSAAIATASNSVTGLLSNTDYTAFGAKQSALPVGTAVQYLRGDQTLAVLNTTAVPEGINLYYTPARFNGDFALKTTDALAEGANNLYFTDARADVRVNAQKGLNNGIASLDVNGKVPNSQLPAVAVTETFVVGSQSAMLALGANQGDVAVRTDIAKTYILQTGPPTTLSNWIEVLTPGSPVQSVNGQTGSVNLLTTDVTEGLNLYYTDARSRAALSAGGPLAYNSSSGAFSITQATTATAGYLSATDWSAFNGKQDAFATGTGLSLSGNILNLTANNAGVTDHNTLANLQGGATGEYYHLNQANFNALNLTTNGQLRNVAGSASAPGYSFDADSDTGMYAAANNNLCFATAGMSRWCIDSAGNWIPDTDAGQNIGSATNRVKDIYLSGTTLYFNTNTLKNLAGALTWDGGNFVTPGGNVGIRSGAIAPNLLSINSATTADSIAQALIATGGTANKGLVIQGAAGQSANLLEAQTSTGAVLAFLTSSGAFNLQNSTNSTAALNIKNAAGTNVATVDTTNSALRVQSSSATTGAFYILNSNGTSAIEMRAGGTGQQNTFIGFETGSVNSSGNTNVGVGNQALRSNTTGGGNTSLGQAALRNNTTGSRNVATGSSTLFSNTSGADNTASGSGAMYVNTTGFGNSAYGSSALFFNNGFGNSAFGASALYVNTTGFNNVAVGPQALFYNTTGYNNIASGPAAMFTNKSGYSNIATGPSALYYNTTGYSNTATGQGALTGNTAGFNNNATGQNALFYNSTGNNNAAFGHGAYSNFVDNTPAAMTVNTVATGTQNSNMFNVVGHGYAVGDTACFRVASTGTLPAPFTAGGAPQCFVAFDTNNFTFIGFVSSAGSGTLTLTPNFQYNNSTAIGSNATITASNQITLGSSSVTQLNTTAGIKQTNIANANHFAGNLGIGSASTPAFALDIQTADVDGSQVARFRNVGATSCNIAPGSTGFACSSDQRLKSNTASIMSGMDVIDRLRGVTFNWNEIATGSNEVSGLQYGFIAQEVERILPNAVSTGADGYKMLNSAAITPFLVRGLQELSAKVQTIDAEVLTSLAKADAVSIKGNLTVGGNLYVNGKLQVGEDTSGTAIIARGKKAVHIAFKTAYPSNLPPKVTATPHTLSTANFAINNISATGFDIVIESAATKDISYDWIALAGGRVTNDIASE